MKNFLVLSILAIFLIFLPTTYAIMINEILPNPEEYSDAEWLELFSEETLNLEGWELNTTGQTYNFENTTIEDFLIITKNKNNFLLLWPDVNESKIIEWTGMGLNNNGEPVYLLNRSFIVDSTTYPSFSSKAGKSWARLENRTFIICDTPTPAAVNNCTGQQPEKEIVLDYPLSVECEEEFYIEIEAFGFEDSDYDVKIDILSEDDEERIGKVWNEEKEKWQSTNNYIISALEIKSGKGKVRLKYKVGEFEGDAVLRPKIRETGSSGYEQFNDESLGVECSIKEESEIKIIDWPTESRFGDEIKVQIEVYRGDTAKYAVYVYVQDSEGIKVSDKVSLHFDEKFQTSTESVILVLKCKNEEGIYEIVAEGLDSEDKKEIKLEPCELMEEKEIKETNKEQTYLPQSSHAPSYAPGSVIESKDFFIRRTAPYILISVILFFVIYLIIKKI